MVLYFYPDNDLSKVLNPKLYKMILLLLPQVPNMVLYFYPDNDLSKVVNMWCSSIFGIVLKPFFTSMHPDDTFAFFSERKDIAE
jgi:hypothetical protein